MKLMRSFSCTKVLVLAILAAGFLTGSAKAQYVEGKFVLPFAAKWGKATLEPGRYTFSIQSSAAPVLAVIRREADDSPVAIIVAQSWESGNSSHTWLTFDQSGPTPSVSSLHIAEIGLTYRYSPQTRQKANTKKTEEMVARASQSVIENLSLPTNATKPSS